jgi:NADH:ubiquinone reductase (H+-translocating)
MKKQKVLVIGGGFAGIKAALELADNNHYEVTLVSDKENFRYYPQLYHAATGGKLAASIMSLQEIFRDKDVNVAIDGAQKIDRQAKTVAGKKKKYNYDILILALGVVTNYFGIKGLRENSYGIKSIEEAVELRDHIHKLLIEKQKPDINYVVIGGGPTGVELAAALPDYIRHIMKKHSLKESRIHVDLVEAAPRLMPRMPKPYSRAVAKRLRKLGVRLYLGQAVEASTAEGLVVEGHSIESHTVVWTAGVTNHPFFSANEFHITEHGKVRVNTFLEAEDNIYVIGDNADTLFSGMAQTAVYDGKFVADNLGRQAAGNSRVEYRSKKPIYITPVGPGWAAMLWGRTLFFGRLAWALRSAADFVAFHDLEPWWRAGRHWLATTGSENECQTCRA